MLERAIAQQRLARALAVEPEVLFLAEPTASLDPARDFMAGKFAV